MTNSKTTKRALLSSVVALLLCFTMLLGTTFAWFTDSVSNGVNKIQAGNLDVVLEHKRFDSSDYMSMTEYEEVSATTPLFLNIDGDPVLWEPGACADEYFKITNNGSLALKYQFKIAFANASETPEGNTLADVLSIYAVYRNYYDAENNSIEASDPALAGMKDSPFNGYNQVALQDFAFESYLLPGESIEFQIGVEWKPSEKDNEFNVPGGLSIDLGATLLATQFTYEKDSTGDQYDKDATYPDIPDVWDGTSDISWYNDTDNTFTLSTAEELAGFAELANGGTSFSGKTIELESNMDLNGNQWTPIKKFTGTLKGNDHTISNFSVDVTTAHGGFIDVLEWATVENLTLTDVTATVGDYRFGALARSINQTNIENVTVKDVNVTTTAPAAFVAGLFATGTVNSNMEVNNCTVENLTVNAEAGAYLIGGITTVVQKNGTEAEGTNIFENLNVKNFKVIVNDTDGICGVGGLVGQTQSVWQNPRFNNCSVTGLDVIATGNVNVGGFICYPGSITFAENCTTEGKIDVSGVTSADNYAGGFFGDYGWGDNISKGDHKVTSCSADVDITTKYASAGGFVGSGTNSEGRNKNITLTNCEAKGTVSLVEGGAANIGGFAGKTDRGIYINCSAAQEPFIGKVLDGYTLNNDGNGTLTVTK